MRAALLLLILVGCDLKEEDYPARVADRYCPALKACGQDAYFDRFRDGTTECLEEVADEVADLEHQNNGDVVCRWQSDAGEACLDALKQASCDEFWFNDCVDVWDCITTTR